MTNIFSRQASVVELLLESNDGTRASLVLTPEHPLWTLPDGAWLTAGHLSISDIVESRSGPLRVIAARSLATQIIVYNFSVANTRSYFVSEIGVWSHNVDPWDALANFKQSSFDALSKAEQGIAKRTIDIFQQRYMSGSGDALSNIRNARNLGDGLWEIKHASGVRVYLDKLGNVIGYSNKGSQPKAISRLKSILTSCG